MFQLDQKILGAYNSLPDWAKDELCGKGACWQYSGNPVLGWNWVADSNLYKRLNFGQNLEIPTNPLAYLDVSHELLYNNQESIEIDFQHHDNHYYFVIDKPYGGEVDSLIGVGSSKLLASIDLYQKVCDYYLETRMPSVTDLDCVDNFFSDSDGHMALDMTTFYAAKVLLESYSHFIVDAYDVGFLERETQIEHGIVKFVEGDVRVYSKYGVKEKPEPKTDYTILASNGSFAISGGYSTGWNVNPASPGTITIDDGSGGTYIIEGKTAPSCLAKVIWKDTDIN